MDEASERAFNARMKMAQFGADQWERRRAYEWRVSIALWALIAASIAIRDRIEIETRWAALASLVVFLAHTLLWLRPLHESNSFDRALIRTNLGEAQPLVGQTPAPPSERKEFYEDWSMVFQALVTLFLLIVFCSVRVTSPIPQ